MPLNLAKRLAAYDLLAAEESRHEQHVQEMLAGFDEERRSLREVIDKLGDLLKDERQERRWLQDRLLQAAAGTPPIYEPSPGQAMQEAQQNEPSTMPVGLRDRLRQHSKEARGVAFATVKKEVEQFIKNGGSQPTKENQ